MVLDKDHVMDKQGNRYEVQFDTNHEPYIEPAGRKIYFKL